MTESDRLRRRRLLRSAGVAVAGAAVAGCLDQHSAGDGGDDDDSNDDKSAADDPDDDGTDGENGSADDSNDDDSPVAIDPGARIEFYGDSLGWEGVEPAAIEGLQNPTLVLEAGETYEIGWHDGDIAQHNIELWDADDALVEDYQTRVVAEPETPQFLEIEATEEMAYYVCEPHDAAMRGEIVVE